MCSRGRAGAGRAHRAAGRTRDESAGGSVGRRARRGSANRVRGRGLRGVQGGVRKLPGGLSPRGGACGKGRGLGGGAGSAIQDTTGSRRRLAAGALAAHAPHRSHFRAGGRTPAPTPVVTPSPQSANVVRMARLTPGKSGGCPVSHTPLPRTSCQSPFQQRPRAPLTAACFGREYERGLPQGGASRPASLVIG